MNARDRRVLRPMDSHASCSRLIRPAETSVENNERQCADGRRRFIFRSLSAGVAYFLSNASEKTGVLVIYLAVVRFSRSVFRQSRETT